MNATDVLPDAEAGRRLIVAVGRSILVIVWHLLSDATACFVDLGPDYHDRHVSTQRADP